MLVQRFVRWCETAGSTERAEGAALLARAFVAGDIVAEDLAAAEAVLTLLADDPSPKVRLALAEELGASDRAPRSLVRTLCEDADPIAAQLAQVSRALWEDDLIDIVATGTVAVRLAVAGRRRVPLRVAAALAEVAEPAALVALLQNDGAAIAGVSYRRIAERAGDDAAVCGAMAERDDVPAAVRQTLVQRAGRQLGAMPLFCNLVGVERAGRVTAEACERATALLAEAVPVAELPALVEHLRASSQLTLAFLLRAACAGNIDLLAVALQRLSGLSARKVRQVLAAGRRTGFRRLVAASGLPSASAPLFRAIVAVWCDAASGRLACVAEDVPRLAMEALARDMAGTGHAEEFEAMLRLLHRIAGESGREAARSRALALAA